MPIRPESPIFGPESPRLEPPNPPKVRVWRSLAKAVSWRLLGTLDTLILSYLLITYLGPWVGFEATGVEAIETAGLIAVTEIVTKMTFYFLHERAWAAIRWGMRRGKAGRLGESYGRTTVKTASWRTIASLDTTVLAWIYTGSMATAVSIGGLEVFTKMTLYFIHERIWVRIPFGLDRGEPATQ